MVKIKVKIAGTFGTNPNRICGAPKRDCKHTCTASCHPATPCPDLRCDFPVTITSSCGRITAIVPCDAGGNGGGFTGDTVFEASVIQKLPVPLKPVEANGKKISLGQRKLVCDDDCVKMERKRVLADAFDITTPNLDALHFGENSSVSDQLADLFRREPKWVLSIEERFKFLVLGKSKGGTTNGLRVHVFCPMLKEKRDAVRQIAERWKLSVHAAGWEPKRFLVVHVTPKSKAPARVLGFKGSSLPLNSSNPPAFDPLVDMDQRLVVALLDLPRDADVSALVLRFGGECELVWLNDKNALAVFIDPARATTALRRLDNGSAYQGAVVVYNSASSGTNAWVGGARSAKEGGTVGALKTNNSVWKGKEGPIITSKNRYNVLDQDSISNSASASSGGIEIPSNNRIGSCSSSTEPKSSNLEIKSGGDGIRKEEEGSEVVVDWEEAYE
ncbi:hypothetical protein BVC80_7225g1 [Macleaya cordata]|uniref:NFXL1 RRM-like domain-containing protein n=1 Tax=Macleaya cordata TaxID=56857 RepID=A0A200PXZ3_MACCD|nr:hypothetical protein BVC80_7225g1 [Macleaya cordata]